MKSLGQLLETINIKPGEIPPGDVDTSTKKTDEYGIYVPEPLNDKKLYGANIDVLQTLDTIEFNTYADGALKQTIAYIKFWGDTKVSPDIVAKEIFKDIELDSEQNKCFELNAPADCQFKVSDSFKYPGVEAVEETQEVGRSISDLTPVEGTKVFNPDSTNFSLDKAASPFKVYDANFHKYLYDLPDDLKALIPIVPKPPTLVQQGQAGLSAIQDLKKQGQAYIQKGRELLIGTPGSKPILDTINNVENMLREVDKILRISGTVLNKTGQVIDIWDNIREAYDVDLDINFTDPIIEKPVPLDIPLSTPVLGYGLDISIDESIFSADVKGAENISTYSCKEVLSKKDGIWQFLFNPSQLSYSYNSDYAVSDVWGTPEGKPLHWKGNNNPELQFNDILLNGYMFGRKVEYLAQGLKDLMGFNGSAYQGSPPVLEFVWGSKTFGPCVMKNLTVTENMWDAGELVGATCSFTLVSMPEWVVNDGQVDIFDPSRTPVFIPRTPDEAPATEATTGDSTLEGGSAAPETNSEEPIVTIKDPPKIPSVNSNSEFIPPEIKSVFCTTVFAQRNNYINHQKGYESTLKEMQSFRTGMSAKEAIAFLDRTNGTYRNWFQAIEAITKAVGVPVLAPNSVSMVESFKKIYPQCFKPNANMKSEAYGMQSLNLYNMQYNTVLDTKSLVSAMICRNNLLKYITDTYKVKCFKTPGQISLPGGNLDSAICVLITSTNDAGQLLKNATSEFPNKLIGKIPANKISKLFNGIDTLLVNGLYNTNLVNKTLRNRQDLKVFYNSILQILNKPINFQSAITNSNSTCISTAETLKTISLSDSARQGINMQAKELINLVNTFNSKCFSPMFNLGNKAIKDKIIRCEKK